jgi:hypothetical protein
LAIVLIEGIVDFVIQMVWLNSGSYGASYGLQPSTVIGWFQLFQNNRLVGLIDDAVLDIAVVAFLGPLFLALFAALRRANEASAAIATSLAFVGIAAYIPTNTGFSLLYVSDQYAAASTDTQRSLFLAAGQATIASGGNGLFESNGFILVAVAGLIVALVMLKSKIFGRAASWVGVLANGLLMENYVPSPSCRHHPSSQRILSLRLDLDVLMVDFDCRQTPSAWTGCLEGKAAKLESPRVASG